LAKQFPTGNRHEALPIGNAPVDNKESFKRSRKGSLAPTTDRIASDGIEREDRATTLQMVRGSAIVLDSHYQQGRALYETSPK